MDDTRRVLDYSDLWVEGSKDATNGVGAMTSNGGKGLHRAKKQKVAGPSSAPSGSNGWSADGTPQSASSTRKVRRILTLLDAGNITQAENELAKMGAGKNNFEIQRALVMAKTGKGTVYSNGNGHFDASYDEDEDNGREDDYEDDGMAYDYENEEHEDFGELDWQGGLNGSGKQLSHEEIWDDSALIDAWNAAEEEYKIFHTKRSAHEKEALHNGDIPKNRSALWYDSPAKGSPAAIAAEKAAKEEQKRAQLELEARKKQARALLEQVAGPAPIVEEVKTANGTPEKPKRLKGTTPPSSSISGNLAWHSACATVSRTANEIGAQTSSLPENGSVPHHTRNGREETSTTTTSTSDTAARTAQGEEIFQNLAMSWYYAGYYQAMAMSWNAEQNGTANTQ